MGISKSTLQRYETGYIKNMPVDKLEEIADALNISPAYLMGWEDHTPTTLAAHFDGDEYTEDELDEIRQFAEFVKGKRGK